MSTTLPLGPLGSAPAGTAAAAAALGARRARILVVDDEPHLLRAYQRMLGRRHELHTAASGREALDELEAGRDVDIILSDVVMPEVDGVQLHQAIAERWPGLERRIVFVTGGAFGQRVERFLDRSGNRRLDKPVRLDDLLAAIDAVLDEA